MDKVDNSPNSLIFNQPRAVIALFAKQPVAGQVKTRLIPPLSPAQARKLYRNALYESVSRFTRTEIPVVICYAGKRDWFQRIFPGFPLVAQHGQGLGERLTNAATALFASGCQPVLLAGTDSPDLPLDLLKEVVDSLDEKDVVVVPCHDGGYAVVGLRDATTKVFESIPWSTANVLNTTRQRCLELGLAYHETRGWYDLDEIEDLRLLTQRSPDSLTARFIVNQLKQHL